MGSGNVDDCYFVRGMMINFLNFNDGYDGTFSVLM